MRIRDGTGDLEEGKGCLEGSSRVGKATCPLLCCGVTLRPDEPVERSGYVAVLRELTEDAVDGARARNG